MSCIQQSKITYAYCHVCSRSICHGGTDTLPQSSIKPQMRGGNNIKTTEVKASITILHLFRNSYIEQGTYHLSLSVYSMIQTAINLWIAQEKEKNTPNALYL